MKTAPMERVRRMRSRNRLFLQMRARENSVGYHMLAGLPEDERVRRLRREIAEIKKVLGDESP